MGSDMMHGGEEIK